ncbi:zinc finger protein, putative [Ichthyophthirius multifiliis]|uniref:Zinc finger protein, putative n=1 Tax=Ichthyophthirius multifiliis TaxID=5932 RepID=G0QSV3_ICHMU|nr:zinc finger protein, putative [Ichthyophthirius multifiliis]EGR31720.1 zinc finger protein, putative [Ichthyophthirius multifiliis]|eukprot:XP_004035206.1 zinc finger protein, putative [Ichthyophthirius multifiliis]
MSQQQQAVYPQSYNTQFQQQNPKFQVIQTPIVQSNKYKTNLCRHFKNGNCQLGSACHFAHGQEELRNTNNPTPINVPTSQPKVLCNNYKTVKCQYFQRGFCKNQQACSFPHGDEEMMSGISSFPTSVQSTPSQGMLNSQDSLLYISIISNLEQVFRNNSSVLQKLQIAQQFARMGDQNNAFQIINEIMKDTSRSEEEKQQYRIIVTNAQIYYQNMYSQQQMFQQQYNNMNQNQAYYMGAQQ